MESKVRRGPTRWAAVRWAAVEWQQPALANRRPGARRLVVGAPRGLDEGFDTRRGAAQGPTVRRQGSGVTDAYGIYLLSPPLVRQVADDARQEHENNGQEHDDDDEETAAV